MINIAVVGCGYWGPNLVRNFYSLPQCRVKTICDLQVDRLDYMATQYPQVEVTTDFNSILGDEAVDAVAIATPVGTHHRLAKKALLKGKHTLVEKPMARSVKECQELITLSRERDLSLVVGHTFIYNPTIRKIKQIVDSGELGEIMYICSRRLNLGLLQRDINVAWDLAPHDLSIILFLLGENPTSVNCQGKDHFSKDIEDVTVLTLNFSNGGFGIIQNSWIDPRKIREMTIVGTKKMLVYDDTASLEKIKIYDKCVQIPPHYDTFAEFHYSYHYGDIYTPYIQQIEPLRIECQHFLECIDGVEECESHGEDGLRVVQILEAATLSLRKNGAKIEIPH